jgi:hypothetical protein
MRGPAEAARAGTGAVARDLAGGAESGAILGDITGYCWGGGQAGGGEGRWDLGRARGEKTDLGEATENRARRRGGGGEGDAGGERARLLGGIAIGGIEEKNTRCAGIRTG